MNLKPKFTESAADHTIDLICPQCGGSDLHHNTITIYERLRGEDDPNTLVTNVNNGPRVSLKFNPNNPSDRRDGLGITFTCESCESLNNGGIMELTIAQHKGTTYFKWRIKYISSPQWIVE